MRHTNRIMIVLFAILAVIIAVSSASAEPIAMTAAGEEIEIDLTKLPEFNLWGHYTGGAYSLYAQFQSELPVSGALHFTVSYNGAEPMEGVIDPITPASHGGNSEWWYRQPEARSHFHGDVLELLVPGEYEVKAYLQLNEYVMLVWTEVFQVEQYHVDANFCQSGQYTMATLYITSLWESLPDHAWLGLNGEEHRIDLQAQSTGRGFIAFGWKDKTGEIALRLPGQNGLDKTFPVPDKMHTCGDEGPIGKGSRTD